LASSCCCQPRKSAFTAGWHYAGTALSGLGNVIGINLDTQLAKVPDITWDRSVSITSALFRLTRTYGFSDLIATVLLVVVLTAVMAAIVIICRRSGINIFQRNRETTRSSDAITNLEWVVLVFVAIIFSPHATARQMVLMLLVFVVAIALIFIPAAKETRTPLIAATALMAVGLTFPPFGIGLNRAYWMWRDIGGASWCAVVLILTIVWAGSRAIAKRNS
jgi:hypothetical protein